jgi:hypothetical protein
LTYLNLSQEHYQQRTLRRFRPIPEVYSIVANAILLNGKNTLPSPKPADWGQLPKSQKGHYISFVVRELGIKDPTLSHLPWQRANVVMFMFVDHLCNKGHMILNTTYLNKAVDYCIEHGSTCCDPRSMDPTSGQSLVAIAKIIQDAKRWDKMTKRQEPITKAMVAHLEQYTSKQPVNSSHDRALIDWAKTGLATGYRGVEWCQYKELKTDADIH